MPFIVKGKKIVGHTNDIASYDPIKDAQDILDDVEKIIKKRPELENAMNHIWCCALRLRYAGLVPPSLTPTGTP